LPLASLCNTQPRLVPTKADSDTAFQDSSYSLGFGAFDGRIVPLVASGSN
jgi:hypothetical protein